MCQPDHHILNTELWEDVRYTRQAIRARTTLIRYTILVSLPFVFLWAVAACLCGLQQHEITGTTCYHAMLTSLFIFDTLRNAAHSSFVEAWDLGLVTVTNGVPLVDNSYPHRRLAQLSFAIGGYLSDTSS